MTATAGGNGPSADTPHPATVGGSGWRGAYQTWGRLRRHADLTTGRLVVLIIFGCLSGIFETLILVVIGRMAVAIAANADRFEIDAVGTSVTLSIGAGIVVGITVLMARLGVLVAGLRMSTRAGARLVLSVRRALLRAYFGATQPAQSEETSSRVVQLVGGHSGALGRGVAAAFNGVVSFLTLLMLVVIAFVIEPVAAGLMTVMLAAISLLMLPIIEASRRASREAAAGGVALTAKLVESTSLALEIRTFAREDRVLEDVDEIAVGLSQSIYAVSFRQNLVPQLYSIAALFLVLAGLGGISGIGVEDVGSVGAVVLVLLRAVTFALPVQSAYQQMLTTEPFLDGIMETVDRLEQDAEPRGGLAPPPWSAVRFRAVSFSYPTGAEVLCGFDLELRRTGTLGLVGPSGGGKTTAIALLLGVLQPSDGRVELVAEDASIHDLATIDPRAWRSSMAFVPQLPRLSSGSVAENIRFYRDLTDETLVDAAKRAHIHHDIVQLPHGYDTLVGELGSDLSGGQRQRISLARALAGTPDMIVLDEPTSSLDASAEQAIIESLEGLRGAVGLVVVAHRLTTLQVCDRIAVVDAGRIQAVGTHDELLRTSPFYRRAVDLGTIVG